MISFGLHIDCLVLTFVLENYKNSNVSGRLVFTIKFCSATIFLWSFYSTSRIFWTFVVQGSVNWREKNHTAKLKELTYEENLQLQSKNVLQWFWGRLKSFNTIFRQPPAARCRVKTSLEEKNELKVRRSRGGSRFATRPTVLPLLRDFVSQSSNSLKCRQFFIECEQTLSSTLVSLAAW